MDDSLAPAPSGEAADNIFVEQGANIGVDGMISMMQTFYKDMQRNEQIAISLQRNATELRELFGALLLMAAGALVNEEHKKSAAEIEIEEITQRLKEHAASHPKIRQAVWEITDGHCFYCRIALIREIDAVQSDIDRLYHIDHLVPKSVGGPDHLFNYVPSCRACNLKKRANAPAQFLRAARRPNLKIVGLGDTQ